MRKIGIALMMLSTLFLIGEAKPLKSSKKKHTYQYARKYKKVSKTKARRPPRYAKRINDPKMGEYLKLEGMIRNAQEQE
ncbi:MAG: hypothetical protein ABDH18_03450 [Aquificaceae bacterium]